MASGCNKRINLRRGAGIDWEPHAAQVMRGALDRTRLEGLMAAVSADDRPIPQGE